jgi:hypothetical protein
MAAMDSRDREYFMLRARQELAAVRSTGGEARRRHEELASAYQMRVTYIDRGLIGADEPQAPAETPAPMPHHLSA